MLLKTIKNNIATVMLNRPELHNAFDDHLIQQLTTELENIQNNADVGVVVLAANGKNFCAGADLNWMRKMANFSYEENLNDAQVLARLMQTLNNLNKSTIALVQGAAYGGGIGLIACCDIAIASMDANFCFSEVTLGLIPAVISPYVIAAIGERAARRYFLTAEKFDAHEAQRLGLIHQVVSSHDLYTTGEQIADLILNNGQQAVARAKKLISFINNKVIDKELINFTTNEIAEVRTTNEAQTRIEKFFRKKNINS